MREEAQNVLGNSSQTAALEMRRLLDENNLLDSRVKQMELDLQVFFCHNLSPVEGHVEDIVVRDSSVSFCLMCHPHAANKLALVCLFALRWPSFC